MTDPGKPTSPPTFSCVVDSAPGMAYSTWVWAVTLTTLGGQPPSSLAVHFVEDCAPELRASMEELGARTAAVERFDPDHPPSNKLAQLSSPLLASAGQRVLCDCDIAFCGDVSAWMSGAQIRARTVDVAGLELSKWRRILAEAGLEPAASRANGRLPQVRALDGNATIPTYCNGGFLVLPDDPFADLRDAWPRWNSWALEHAKLLGRTNYHADQVSFALACIERGLQVDLLPPEFNLPTHIPQHLKSLGDVEPLVFHYHRRIDPEGRLEPTGVRSIDGRIAAVNSVINEGKQGEFDPALLRGVGSDSAGAQMRRRVTGGMRRVRAALGG